MAVRYCLFIILCLSSAISRAAAAGCPTACKEFLNLEHIVQWRPSTLVLVAGTGFYRFLQTHPGSLTCFGPKDQPLTRASASLTLLALVPLPLSFISFTDCPKAK